MPDHDVWLDEGIKADKTDAMLAVIAQTFARSTFILVVGRERGDLGAAGRRLSLCLHRRLSA